MLLDIHNTAGVRMHGWNHDSDFCKAKIAQGEMIHLLAETSNICDFDCEYCYTVEVTLDNPRFHAKPLVGELSLEKRKSIIDEAVSLGAVSYDIVGAGEPLIDPLFFEQLEYAVSKGLTPIIFTNGSILGNPKFSEKYAKRLWELGASVVIKWHSKDWSLHDQIVRRKGAAEKRDRAIELLKRIGFNKTSPTRLGIDNIIYQTTTPEIPDCLRMCRGENMFLVCSTYIPSGRTKKGNEKELPFPDLIKLYDECRSIDEKEFGIQHSGSMPYIGYGKTCTQYMGLYVTIQGDTFGCVGKSESYGNVKDYNLVDIWQKRLPLLQKYDGGCPPRQKFHELIEKIDAQEIKKIF